METFSALLICTLNKRLSKQSQGWWFETKKTCDNILPIITECVDNTNISAAIASIEIT